MSSIANQLVAVVATLLGFVTHDVLTERSAPATVVASVQEASVDPVVTRSINLAGLSADWLAETQRAERAVQPRPSMRVSSATAAARPVHHHVDVQFADVHINQVRVAAPGQQIGAFLR